MHILDTYLESYRRYAKYFLKYPQSVGPNFNKLEVEIPNLHLALQWAIQTGENSLVPEFWNYVKDHLWDHGYWQVFFEWGENALEALHDLKEAETEAWTLSELGWFWMEQGEFVTAEDMFRRSQDIFRSIDLPKGVCAIERYIGVLAYRMGNLDSAADHYNKALEIAIATVNVGMIAEIRNLQGSLARKVGDFALARECYYAAREAIEELGDIWRLTAVLRNLARMEFQLGNFASAKEGFLRTIELCEQIDRKDMLYGCQLRLAEVELKLGDMEHARSLAIAARNGFVELGMKRDLDEANQFLSELV